MSTCSVGRLYGEGAPAPIIETPPEASDGVGASADGGMSLRARVAKSPISSRAFVARGERPTACGGASTAPATEAAACTPGAGAGVAAWCGGMLETGLGRALNATLAGHRACTMVGDVSGGMRFAEVDPFGLPVMRAGRVDIHRDPGIGPAPDDRAMRAVTARQLTVTNRS